MRISCEALHLKIRRVSLRMLSGVEPYNPPYMSIFGSNLRNFVAQNRRKLVERILESSP